jgi:hypothetical protein
VVEGAAVVRQLEAFLERLARLQLPSLELYLTLRVDDVIALEDALRAWLPRLSANRCSLHLWNIGLENFSVAENERFNKGITTEQMRQATRLLRDLEARWPDAFCWSKYGGFGMIVFTPWTTLDDLTANLDGLRDLDLRWNAGMLSSRLQLLPGTPISRLAEFHGLLVRDASEWSPVPAHVSCLVDDGNVELPWRFSDPQTREVYRLMTRFFPREGPSTTIRMRHTPPFLADPIEGLETFVELVREHPQASFEHLLNVLQGRARQWLRNRRRPHRRQYRS